MLTPDFTRNALIYDGFEPDFQTPEFALFAGGARLVLGDFVNQPLEALRADLATRDFEQIVEEQGLTAPPEPWQTWHGTHDLALYYYWLEKGRRRDLVILAYGEYQPARYMIYVEGIWTFTH